MTFLVVSVQRERIGSRAANIGSMSPLGYRSAWLHACRACLRFTRQVHFSSAVLNFQFARLAGGTIPFIRRYSTI
jgi:hypothetical protein